jgi:protein TonB
MRCLALFCLYCCICTFSYGQRKQAFTFNDDHGIEKVPEYPGGKKAFTSYIQHNLKFPPGKKLSGRVILAFIVEKNGTLSHVKITKHLAPLYDAEALKVLDNCPQWIPAKVNKGSGWKPIRAQMSLPIAFSRN